MLAKMRHHRQLQRQRQERREECAVGAAATVPAEQEMLPQEAVTKSLSGLTLGAPTPTVSRPPVHRRGSGGTEMRVATNLVRLVRATEELGPGFGFHLYLVRFEPEINSRDARFRLLGQHREALPVKNFDGARLLLPKVVGEDKHKLTSRLPTGEEVS